MQKRTKSIFPSILFVLFCFCVCGASLYYFFTDLNRTTVRDDKVIATIHFKKRIAQRKFSDSVVWERLQTSSALYNEDIIRTDAAAAATLNFQKGSIIVDIDENTMIQIFEGKDGDVKLSVSGGNFTVDTSESSQSVKIDLGNGSVINLDKGSRLSAAKKEDGDNSVLVIHGTGSIVTDSGEEEFILEGDSIKIDESGNRNKIPVSVTNLDTAQKFLIFEGEEKNINLNLKVDSSYQSKKIIFETSNDSDFSKITETQTIEASDKISYSLSKGTVYYRVYPESQKTDAYNGKILVEEIKPPKFISPNVDFTFESVDAMPDVKFIWDSGIYADYCLLEVYDVNDSMNPVVRQEVLDDSAKISGLNKGKYFWKVIPHYSINNIGFKDFGNTRTFAIERQKINPVPELSVPGMGSSIVLSKDKKDVLFACKSDVKESEYRFEVSKVQDFSKDIVISDEQKTVRTSIPLSIEDLPAGKYYWRVVRIDENNNELFSNVRDFTVSQFVPKTTELVFPPENYSVESTRLSVTQFIWNLSDSFNKSKTNSIVEIAKDKNFTSDLKSFSSSGISYTGVVLSQGEYYWRVRAINSDDNSEVAKTDSRKIIILNELSKPEITSPADNESFALYDNESVTVNWKTVDGAEYYKVKVSDKDTGSVISSFDAVRDNSVSVAVPKNKKVNVNITAYCEETELSPARISKASEVSFAVRGVSKIQLVSPANFSRIEGVTSLRKPVVFTWKEDSLEKKKEFVLTRIYPNGTSKIVQTIKNPSGSVSLSRLTPGTYRWTVNASSADGASLTPDVSYNFTVTPIPELSKVQNLIPSSSFIIDADYLRKNRSVSFSWNPHAFATDYEFVLYQKNENGTLRKIISEKTSSTKYQLTDLTKLDIGKFEWHVTAFVHAYDGYEEQKSSDAVSEFEVRFDLPDTVKTIDPGRMYAD